MKPNYAKRNMRKSNNTQFRPEQYRLRDFLSIDSLVLEHRIEFKCEGRTIIRIADLADLDKKILYFLNGEIHSPKKDAYNKLEIETYTDWKVINIYKDSEEWNFLWKG